MSRSATATVRLVEAAPPGSIVVVAPREIARDELRLARLEGYLHAEFPGLDFTISQRASGVAGGFVGVVGDDGSNPALPGEQARELVGRVIKAVRVFIDYGDRRH